MRIPAIRLTPMTIAVLLGAALSVGRLVDFAPLSLLDARAVDLRLLARGRQLASPEVVVVAVDNASIEEIGRWPWSRSVLANLLDAIDAADPKVIGFDIVQSEATAAPDLTPLAGRVSEEALEEVGRAFAEGNPEDQALASAVARSGRVVLGYFFDDTPGLFEGGDTAPVTSYGAVQSTGEKGERRIPEIEAIVANIPLITAAAKATGYFNTVPDVSTDGHHRELPMVARLGDRLAMPLSLAMLTVAEPGVQPLLRIDDSGVQEIRFGKRSIPVAEDGHLLLNFRGPGQTFPHVPASDVLMGRVDPKELEDKFVLVGVTATAVADVRATAFDGVYPGVEIHATALDNMLTGEFLYQPRWMVLVEIAAIFASVLLLGAVLGRLRGVTAALFSIALAGIWLASSQWLFLTFGVPLGVVYPIVAIALVYMSISVHHFVAVEREKRRTRDAFSRYLNPELARLVSENPEMLRLGGTRQCLTVLFSDVRGFTSISEKIEPETLVEILNVYLGEMTGIIFEHDGTLDKYIGDAIMAVWGAPVAFDDHAARACAAALEMVDRLRERREDWARRGWPPIAAGIGLHTGDMVAGNMGSTHHLSYTVMGDNVNLGSRLEGLTKVYGVSLLVSEATLEAAGDDFVARELDLVAVKGKAQPVRIYELLGRGPEAAPLRDLQTQFEAALALFRDREWETAAAAFSSILELAPEDGPSMLYVERCAAFAADPPPEGWDGVTIMETK